MARVLQRISGKVAEDLLSASSSARDRGDVDGALHHALEALHWFEDAGRNAASTEGKIICGLGMARSLSSVAEAYTVRQDWENALDYFQKARAAYDEAAGLIDDDASLTECAGLEGFIMGNIARCHGVLGDHEAAYGAAKGAESAYHRAGDNAGRANALLTVSIAALCLDRKDEAKSTLNRVASLGREMKDPKLVERVRGMLAQILD